LLLVLLLLLLLLLLLPLLIARGDRPHSSNIQPRASWLFYTQNAQNGPGFGSVFVAVFLHSQFFFLLFVLFAFFYYYSLSTIPRTERCFI